MRRILPVLAAAAIGLPAAQAAPLNPAELPDASVSPEDGFRQVARKVAPRVWLLHQREPFQVSPIGNVTVIEQSDGLVLVDSGASKGSGQRVVEMVRRVSRKPVKAVAITHWHNDHPLGLPAILAAWPKAQVIAAEATRAHMAAGKLVGVPLQPSAEYDAKRAVQLEGYVTTFGPNADDPKLTDVERRGWARLAPILRLRKQEAPGTHLMLPTVTFTDRHLLPDRDAPLEVLFLGRGNTSGDAVVWAPKQRVLVAGDLVVSPIPYAIGGYPKDWAAVLERLKAFDFATLIPGHGLPQTDRRYLDRLTALISAARERAAPLAAETLTEEQVNARIDLSDQRRIFAGDDPWLGYWFDQYAANIGFLAYREARGDELDA